MERLKGAPQKLTFRVLPSNLSTIEEDNMPQAKLHVIWENGMAVSVGRLREDSLFDYKSFLYLQHTSRCWR